MIRKLRSSEFFRVFRREVQDSSSRDPYNACAFSCFITVDLPFRQSVTSTMRPDGRGLL